MTVGYTRDLDPAQAYTFTPAAHRPVGYITALTVGDSVLAPDIAVTGPAGTARVAVPGQLAADPGAGSLTQRVVAVLSHLDWSTLPNENITLRARVSAPTAQTLRMLATSSMRRIVTSIGVTVYDYDAAGQAYYPSFGSYAGTAPGGSGPRTPAGPTFGPDDTHVVYGQLATTSALTVAGGPAADPVGIINVAIEVTLSPTVAAGPQQFRVQSSTTVKLIRPWGLPQT